MIQGSQNWAGVHALSVSGEALKPPGSITEEPIHEQEMLSEGFQMVCLPVSELPNVQDFLQCLEEMLTTAALLSLPSQHACSQHGSGPLHTSTPAFSGCSAGF